MAQALVGFDVPLCVPLREALAGVVVFRTRSDAARWWAALPDALAMQAIVDLNTTGAVRATALVLRNAAESVGLRYDEAAARAAMGRQQAHNATAGMEGLRAALAERADGAGADALPADEPGGSAARAAGRSRRHGRSSDGGEAEGGGEGAPAKRRRTGWRRLFAVGRGLGGRGRRARVRQRPPPSDADSEQHAASQTAAAVAELAPADTAHGHERARGAHGPARARAGDAHSDAAEPAAADTVDEDRLRVRRL